MKLRDFSVTPNKITELSCCEVFVFGSNLKGYHGGGAARVAMEKFGAEWGVGVGPTGQCYAIPTMQGDVETIEPYVNRFLEYAKTHQNNRFLVTRIGCGIAGFDDMYIAPLFEEAVNIPNIALPKTWWDIIGKECGVWRTSPSYSDFPKVWTLKTLNKYTTLHKYEIGAGVKTFLPDLKVRYIKGRGEFGYAKFGDFFFDRNQMYVWETDDKYAEEHDDAVVREVFHDECKGRGYVCQRIYAGVQTNFRDINGEIIYTGDVIKVQEKNDSMEMLKRPEAAELKNVGRFYLQVGYNELFMLGQSAWAGAKYYPSDKVKKIVDHSVNVIDDIGYIRRSIEAASKTEEAHGEELANILGSIIETADRLGVKSDSLWLDNIPNDIYIDNIVNKYNISFYKNIIEAIIGEYDDPSNQRQFVLKVNLNNNGNTIIFGSDGNDREMCLDSIIYSTTTRHSTKEINYYIIDYGSEALRKFSNFPHIGDMVFANEEEKLNNLMKMIKDIIKERKKLFISYSGNYNTYIRESKEELPLIGVIINNYDAFYEGNVSFDEELASLTRDALRYGIFFIITASGDNSIRRKIKQNFNTILALRLNDEMAYNTIFTKINNVPRDTMGRGLFKTDKVYEFQTADIIDTTKENEYLVNIGNRLKEINNFVARRVPTLPDIITPNTVNRYLNGIGSVPIGISKNSLEVVTYDFTTYLTTFVLGSSVSNTINFSRSLLYEIASIKNIQLILVDMNSDLIDLRGMIRYYFNENPNNVIDLLIDYIDKIKDKNIKSVIYFQDFNKFKIKVDDKKLETFVKSIKYLENISIIIVDDYKKIKKSEYESWYRNMQNDTDGIWIGTGLYDQNLFKLSKLTKEMGNTYKNNFAYVITDGRADLIKTIELEEYREQGDNDE